MRKLGQPMLAWRFHTLMTPLLGLVVASGGLLGQIGPMLRTSEPRGPDLRLPELELPDLLLELDGKPLLAGTLVRAELVGAEKTTTIDGHVDEAGLLKLGKTRNLGLLRSCDLRITADFLPLREGQLVLADQKQKPRKWFQYNRRIKLDVSPVRCRLERRDSVLLGMGQLLDADKRPLVGMELRVFSYKKTLWDVATDDSEEQAPPQHRWSTDFEAVLVLGNTRTNAVGRFAIWATKPVECDRTFSVHFHKKGLLAWAGFRALSPLEGLRYQVSPTRRLVYELVLPSDLPMDAVGLRLKTPGYSDFMSVAPSRLQRLRQVGAKTHWRVDYHGLPQGEYRLELFTKANSGQIQVSKPTKIVETRVEYPDDSPRLDWSNPPRRIPIQIRDANGDVLQGSWLSLQAHDDKKLTIYSLPTDEQGQASPALISGGEALVIWSREHKFLRIKNPRTDQRIRLHPVRATHFQIPSRFANPRPNLSLELLLHIPPNSGSPLPPPAIRGWWRAALDAQGFVKMKVGWPGLMHLYLTLTNTSTNKHWLVPALSYFDYLGLDDRSRPIQLSFDPKTFQAALDKIGIR